MYRHIDEEVILKNLGSLEDNAKQIYLNTYEPTIHEIKKVYSDIMNFIKEKKRIIYGGFAQNSLIKHKNKDDAFYKETDIADVEFYTPDPIGDTIDLVDMLHKKNYKYVEGKEGVHPETYKIFVNFINYCDISYMPENIYKNCPKIEIDGIYFTHPHFMLIDAYRVYSDPMTSYFRLTKTFTRFNKLMHYYPLNEDMLYNKSISSLKANDNLRLVLHFIRHKIIITKGSDSKLIVVGHYAFNQLMKMAKAPETYLVNCTYYQLISVDYSNDIQNIHNIMKKQYPNVVVKKYHPFFQFLDRSTEFFININGTLELVLRVYDANERCIVYRKSDKKKTLFGTYQLIFMYNLIQYNISKIRGNEHNKLTYGSMLIRMMKARDKYLEQHNKTVLDKTIFQEFTMSCIGEPKDLLRESFLLAKKKREEGKRAKFLYKPTGQPGKKPNFRFDNSSGELM
jgi:hypothetical protein